MKSFGVSDFALDDGEVDLHLIQPRGVHRGVHHDRVGVLAASRSIAFWPRWEEPLSTTQNTRSADVGLLGHDLFDQGGERNDAGGVLAAAVDLARCTS
jgi:hypothetical protein